MRGDVQPYVLASIKPYVSAKSPTAEVGGLVAHAFLVGKAHDLEVERERDALLAEIFHASDGEQNTEWAVVFARIANGIEVRAEKKSLCAAMQAFPATEEIEGGIFADDHARRAHPAGDKFVRAPHGRRMERACDATGLVADGAEFVAAVHQLPR